MKSISALFLFIHLAYLGYAQAPVATIVKKELITHGDKRIDNYYWLREANNPKVRKYLEDENAYLKTTLSSTQALQDKIFDEIEARLKDNNVNVPYKSNGYFYYSRYEGDSEYAVYLRVADRQGAKEEVLIDGGKTAKGHSYFEISPFGIQVSPDNRWLALGIDSTGEGAYIILFKNLETGTWLTDNVKNVVGDIAWVNDSKAVFYSCYDAAFSAAKVKKHVIGEPSAKDETVFNEKDKRFDIYMYKSKSGKYIVLRSFSGTSTEYRVLYADKPASGFRVIQPREDGLEYSIHPANNKLYILTNYNASNFRVMEVSDTVTTKDKWKEIVAMNNSGRIFEVEVFNDYLVLQELVSGIEQIRVVSLKDYSSHYIKFDEEIHSVFFAGGPVSENHDTNTEWLRFTYSSLTTPDCVFEYNMRTRERRMLKQKYVSDGYTSSDYESKRVYAVAKDSSPIPISLVYKKGIVLNGNNPLLLTGYGAYGGYDSPKFSEARVSLLNRGFVYAIAHVRGGEEMGRKWYEDGKQLKKINTFNDFISCAELLVSEGYTNPKKLFAQGQSAGGLIMGYVANNRPDLFRGLVMDVPFLDVVTTMQGDSYDFAEWGNPKIKSNYEYMLSYSPYDNIKDQVYPPMLISSGFYDQYWDAAKWVAKVRANNRGDNPVLLSTDFNSGHDGTSGKITFYKQIALQYAFILSLCGINE